MKLKSHLIFAIAVGVTPMAVSAQPANPTAATRSVEPFRNTPSWHIGDWKLRVTTYCSFDEHAFWPDEPVCAEGIGAYKNELPVSDAPDSNTALNWQLRNLTIAAENQSRTLEGDSEGISVGGKWGSNIELHALLMQMEDPVATFQGMSYRLVDFKKISFEEAKSVKKEANALFEKKRWSALGSITSVLGTVLLSFFVLRFIARRGKRLVPKIAAKGLETSRALAGDIEAMRARRIASDETIRAATRAELDSPRAELANLREQIARALDSGNTDLARTLMNLLRKLEGDKLA